MALLTGTVPLEEGRRSPEAPGTARYREYLPLSLGGRLYLDVKSLEEASSCKMKSTQGQPAVKKGKG